MQRTIIAVGACLALAGGLAVAQAARAQHASVIDPAVIRGHDLLQHSCAGCHAIEGAGDSPNPAAPAFRDLHLRYPVENLSESLAEGIIVGHPQMPQLKFTPEQVGDIIGYLKGIQTREADM